MEKQLSYKEINYKLICAVRHGNLEETRELINSYGLFYSKAWSQGYNLLCDALKNKHAAVAKLLLTSSSKVNSNHGDCIDSPLHLAVINGDTEIVKMILDRRGKTEIINHYAETPLHIAVKKGCCQIVEDLLKYGACVNCVSTCRNGYTPLHFAVERGYTRIITLLLSRGANVDIKGEDSMTPLHIAAKKSNFQRHIRIAEDLLNHGACINSSTLKEEYTPLHFATELDNEEAVQLFLNKGADVNASTKNNLTSLHIATKRGCETLVKLLLQHGAKVDKQDKEGKTILQLAVEKGNLTIVENVLKYCPDINDKSNRNSLKFAVQSYGEVYKKIVEAILEYGISISPGDTNNPMLFHTAVERAYLRIVEDLLKYGADVNTLHNLSCIEGLTPLHSAAKSKQEEVAKLLLSYGASINAQDGTGKTPIYYAIMNADSKMTKLLLNNKASVKVNSELLNIAVRKKCIEIIEALLQHDFDINLSDEHGKTALHFTAESEGIFGLRTNEDPDIDIRGDIAKLLLSKGANVDAKTLNGVTTLHAAAEKGYVKVVEALLEYNANIHSEGKNNITALHSSARSGNKEISMMLLNRGANIDAELEDGTTALHMAAWKGHEEFVKLMLECGAKVDFKMKDGTTPLHLAAEMDHQEVVETILKFGADIDSRDEFGRTALHIASQGGYDGVVATLLEYGSDINITSKKNRTSLDYVMAGIKSFNNPSRYDPNNDTGYDPRRAACTQEILKRHIVKMKVANLYVSKRNLLLVRGSQEIRDFRDECKEEIARMKTEKINNTNISFYDILAKDTNSLAICMKNENIVEVLKSDDYKTKFPIYSSMIGSNFRKSMERKELLEQVNKIVHILFNNFPELPYDCVEKIISYLSDKDLRNVINACKPLSQ